jgi:hypothetical protein
MHPAIRKKICKEKNKKKKKHMKFKGEKFSIQPATQLERGNFD